MRFGRFLKQVCEKQFVSWYALNRRNDEVSEAASTALRHQASWRERESLDIELNRVWVVAGAHTHSTERLEAHRVWFRFVHERALWKC